MKTILVDAWGTLVTKNGIFEEMQQLLDSFENKLVGNSENKIVIADKSSNIEKPDDIPDECFINEGEDVGEFYTQQNYESDQQRARDLIDANVKFADKIYEEAYVLEQYEDSGKLSDNIRLAHDKYDILRTFLWVNSIETSKKCKGSSSTVVYLYQYEPKDLTKKATQKVWSRILLDLKQQKGNKILLIPIAVDNNLVSLNSKLKDLNITEFPVVVINDKNIITELSSVEELKEYL